MNHNKSGYLVAELLVLLCVVLVIGIAGWAIVKHVQRNDRKYQNSETILPSPDRN